LPKQTVLTSEGGGPWPVGGNAEAGHMARLVVVPALRGPAEPLVFQYGWSRNHGGRTGCGCRRFR